jgi:hypothetical protein
MVNAGELRRIAAFSDLPDNQLDWFLGIRADVDRPTFERVSVTTEDIRE